METDIVERCRAAGRDERLSTGALYLEAADEIERLRKIAIERGDQLISANNEVLRLRAEVADLRRMLTFVTSLDRGD